MPSRYILVVDWWVNMSTWTLFVQESGGDWPSGGTSTVPRPNEDLDVGKTTTQQAIQLADGSVGYFTPETKSIKSDLTFVWVMKNETFFDEINGYIDNHDYIKITTHTGKDYIGRFGNVMGKWLVGEEDEFLMTVTFIRMSESD